MKTWFGVLLHGNECHTFIGNQNLDFEVEYRYIEKLQLNQKQYKFVATETTTWREFASLYISQLRKQILHQYVRRKQYTERFKLCNEIHSVIIKGARVAWQS